MKHTNNFDLIRLLAALQVVAMHAGEWLKLTYPPHFAWLWLFPGVPIFFVTSGFLITGSFMRQPDDLGQYARNRMLRIYPGLIANLVAIFVLMVVTGAISAPALANPKTFAWFAVIAATGWTKLASSLFGSQFFTFSPETLQFFPGGVLWTVGVEIGFYLLLPIMLACPRWLATIFAISLGIAIGQMWIRSSWIDTTVPAYLWIFLLGVFARVSWRKTEWMFRGTFPIWLAAHLLLWTVPDYKSPTFSVIVSVFTLAGCTLSFAYTATSLSRILKGQDISYGIYLYHMPVVLTLIWLGNSRDSWIWLAVFALTSLLATLSWVFVERPALALKNSNQSKLPVTA